MKTYLGDGAYAEWDGNALVLTSENGIDILDRIVLEPEHYSKLMAFMRKVFPELT